MHILSNFHHEATQRYEGQEASILLPYLCDYVSCEKQTAGIQGGAFAWTYRKENERSHTRKNVRFAKRKASQSKGSKFLQECRSRKGRYSLNCAVMRRSADKEPHVNKLETPFMTMAGRVEASAVLHEWQTDALIAAAGNKQVEGDDAANGTTTPTVRYGMYCQISSKYAIVSDTQQAVDKAGRSSEMSYQVAKRLAELKREMEFACMNHQGSSAGSATVARSTASIESWLTTPTGASVAGNSTDVGSGGGYTTPGWVSAGTVTAPTDSSLNGTAVVGNLKAVIRACWDAGGNPGIIMCASGLKTQISAFAGIATIYREAGSTAKGTAIVGAADQQPVANDSVFAVAA